MTDPRTLIALIRDLDMSVQADSSFDEARIEYAYVIRWNTGGKDSGGETDEAATTLFRQLLRERLGSFPLDEIGAAVLADIDSRSQK